VKDGVLDGEALRIWGLPSEGATFVCGFAWIKLRDCEQGLSLDFARFLALYWRSQ